MSRVASENVEREPLFKRSVIVQALLGFLLTLNATAQTVEFEDGKSIPLANEASLLKAKELIGDQNWLAAAKQALEILESSTTKLHYLPQRDFQLPGVNHDFEFNANRKSTVKSANRFKGGKVFCNGATRAQVLVCSWAEQAPEALEAYRDLVDAEARALYDKAITNSDAQGLREISRKYFSSRVGDLATNKLAHIEFEQGNFLLAAGYWDSLIADSEYPSRSMLRYPDSNLPERDLMIRSLEASLLAKDFLVAELKLSFIEEKEIDSPIFFLGKKISEVPTLRKAFDQVKSHLATSSPTVGNGWLDIKGKPDWSFPLRPQPNDRSPFVSTDLARTETMPLELATFPDFFRSQVYWCDQQHVYQAPQPGNLKSGTEIKPRKIWSTQFPKETARSERKKLGRPVFDLELDQNLLFARMGDSRTSYRNDLLTRNRSYIVGLDLAQNGALLPGFPLENQDVRVEFDSTPVHQDGYLFVTRRKTFRDNATGQVIIQCLELSRSNRVTQPRVVWENELVSAESNNRGLWDEVSRSKLIMVERHLIFLGSGFVLCLDKSNGAVQWVAEYYRDRFEFAGGARTKNQPQGPNVRTQDQVLYHQGDLYLAPSDSEEIFCLCALSGRCRWKARFPNVNHLIGATEEYLLAGGHRLNWISKANGQLKARFPSTVPDSDRGYALPPTRGRGKGTVSGNFVYWPTMNRIFILGTQLKQFSCDLNSGPRIHRIIDLKVRDTTGGNLRVVNGIMLLANEKEINAYVE